MIQISSSLLCSSFKHFSREDCRLPSRIARSHAVFTLQATKLWLDTFCCKVCFISFSPIFALELVVICHLAHCVHKSPIAPLAKVRMVRARPGGHIESQVWTPFERRTAGMIQKTSICSVLSITVVDYCIFMNIHHMLYLHIYPLY